MTDFDRRMIELAEKAASIYDFTRHCEYKDIFTMLEEMDFGSDYVLSSNWYNLVYSYFLRLIYLYSNDDEAVEVIYTLLDSVIVKNDI